ncbi:XkdQ/YqbQ family protein [Faecalispora anaeroviscerum]|uniref:XkdQ/YqbQ family protein n=1 Tax=Faecalispora anaeroviscerum TaxID=2991836 RepID=UPI0024BB771E|nr:hypothetical protein [Faecalispora anaeroviscerum]
MLEAMLTAANEDTFDISQVVDSIEFTDNINQAGVCTFSILQNDVVTPEEGSAFSVKYGGDPYFKGFVFKNGFSNRDPAKITAYDQLRYLKAKDTYSFKNKTASQAAQQIFSDFGLKAGTIEDTGYNLGNLSPFDDKVVLDMISDCINLTLRSTQKYFYIKDEYGLAVLHNIQSTISDLLVSTSTNIDDFSYERGIDDETYNQIKLVRDNKDTGKREVYISKDSSTIKKWGLLQYYEKLDDSVNAAQAKAKSDALLGLKNKVQQKLTGVEVLGDKSIRAGYMVYVDIPRAGIKKFLLCTKAVHTFTDVSHTVKADFKLV